MEGSCHIWREPFCACCMCRSLGGNQNSKQVTNGCTPFFEFTMKQKFLFLLTLVYTLLSTPCLAGVIEQNGSLTLSTMIMDTLPLLQIVQKQKSIKETLLFLQLLL